jgi:beta-glucosidase
MSYFKSHKRIFLLTCLLFLSIMNCREEVKVKELPFMNSSLSMDRRIQDLLDRMTLEEKINQMMYEAPAIERLGLPPYNWWNEGLHGVARAGVATVFPQAVGLAAMWDENFLFHVATVISDEARAKHHEFARRNKRGIYQGLTFWSPNINLFRDPRWGRGMETFGEDPFLTGRLAISFIQGLQGNDPRYLKVVATPKHFAVHSGPEPDRHSFDARVSQQDLWESYLPQFRDAIVEGRAYSIMCAYNRFKGVPCCGSSELIRNILRGQWQFEGYVVSDCWAVHDFWNGHKFVASPAEATAIAVQAGTDLECGDSYPNLLDALSRGLISESDINTSVQRLLRARFKLGMFDPPDQVAYTSIPISVNDCAEHDQAALEAARKSIVLLKNDQNLLPLSKELKHLAVIGPNSDQVEVLLGNYNGTPSHPVTPLTGIKNKLPGANIVYAPGCESAQGIYLFEKIPVSALFHDENQPGLSGLYFANQKCDGQPALVRTDQEIDFYWGQDSPDPGLDDDNFSIRWSGYLVAPETGWYSIGTQVHNGCTLYLNDSLLFKTNTRHGPYLNSKSVYLKKEMKNKLIMEYYSYHNEAMARLVWAKQDRPLQQEALQAARNAEIVIMFMGLSPRLEGEEMEVPVEGFRGGDRVSLNLPAIQENLMKEIHKLGKPIILVLLNGSAVSVNWADQNIPAIIEAWYPGQQGGTAIADVLFGDYNPAGRLPVTFYRSADQLPDFKDYSMKNRTYRYSAQIPLYPFGHGLSYTQFEYHDLSLSKSEIKTDDSIEVKCTITNKGTRAGEEVVQLYLTHLNHDFPLPIRSLKGFKRLFLEPGQEENIIFTLSGKQIALIDPDGQENVLPGEVMISVGGKQPGFKGNADARTTGILTTRFIIKGDPYPVRY